MLRISPAGLSAAPVANQLAIHVTFREEMCEPYCITSSAQPYSDVEYTTGTPQMNGNTVFIPITARILIGLPGCCNTPTVYSEQFYVAFQGQTALPASVSIESVGRIQNGSDVHCGCAYAYSINDSLKITLNAAATSA